MRAADYMNAAEKKAKFSKSNSWKVKTMRNVMDVREGRL